MAFHPITAFKNPVTRPRAIIWTGTVLTALCLFVAVMVGATTSYWFCAEICHKVQDDSIVTYNRSTHSRVSCVSCHMPAGANPVAFLIHKVELLAELPMTIAGTYKIPLNGESEVSQSSIMMPDTQCTQCHNLANRTVTPSAGIIIDHNVHTESGVRCTLCHNRIAHDESGDWKPVNVDPNSGKLNVGHANFMKMSSCYRCHGLEAGSPAPGTCAACHSAGFDLKPADHKTADFMQKHGEAAKEEGKRVEEVVVEYKLEGAPTPESKTAQVEKLAAKEEAAGHGEEELPLAPAGTINRCFTCHAQETFCNKCHGMAVPHAAEFLKPKSAGDPAGHPAAAKNKALAAKCVMCHGEDSKTGFCSNCHHGEESGWKYDAKVDWTTKQHAQAVAKGGVESCTKQCHAATFCSDCHTKRKIVPASHKAKNFVKPAAPAMTAYGKTPAAAKAGHATAALSSTESCAVCHGSGGINAKFCKGCHKMDMPHEDNFKKFHSKSKKADCKSCHGFKEVCSSCHHVGATASTTWIKAHGLSVNKNGSDTCVGKCHKQDACVKCHQSRKVVPASHKSSKFVKGGAHVTAYKKDATNCLFCHSGAADTLQNSKFCKGCHKLDMPHAINDSSNQKFEHKDGFAKKAFTKAQCLNCHSQRFCDACHHKESKAGKKWLTFHPGIVKKGGADSCFECHKETECSQCHVGLSKR